MSQPTEQAPPPNGTTSVRWKDRDYESEFKRLRGAQLLVLSFPKSGRTWHRVMVGCYLAKSSGLPESIAFDLRRLCAATRAKRIAYSHDGANFDDGLEPANPIVASPALWQGRAVLLITRNPKDVLVSAYHHARYRNSTFDGSLSDFVRDPRTGIVKIVTALSRWQANRNLASSFDVTSYEDMHLAPQRVLRRTLALIGVRPVDNVLLRETVEFCRFEKMQEYERTDFFQSARLNNTSGDPRASKVRAGQVAGFGEYLSRADEAYIEECVAKAGNPFATLAM